MAAQYTLVIGTKDWSSWSLRRWLALKATGAPFVEVFIHLRQTESSPEIRKYSPSGKVPLLKIKEEHSLRSSCGTALRSAKRWPNGTPKRNCGRTMRGAARGGAGLCGEMHSGFPHLREIADHGYGAPRAIRLR